jgi:hypothetical protein
MTSASAMEVRKIDRAVTALLDEWTARTKRRHAVGDSLSRLEAIATRKDPNLSLAARLLELADWLDRWGQVVIGEGVKRRDLEALVAATEALVEQREQSEGAGSSEKEKLGELIDNLVGLIRKGTASLGLEYTPAGLLESPGKEKRESDRVRRSLLEKLQGFEDIKSAYKKALEFQSERLEYFYQEDTHLLTVLDYQLKNLEARPNPDDELFAAGLLYFLGQHNYQIKPYLKRFQKVVAQTDAVGLWEHMS